MVNFAVFIHIHVPINNRIIQHVFINIFVSTMLRYPLALHKCTRKGMYNCKYNIHLMDIILSSIWKKHMRENWDFNFNNITRAILSSLLYSCTHTEDGWVWILIHKGSVSLLVSLQIWMADIKTPIYVVICLWQ